MSDKNDPFGRYLEKIGQYDVLTQKDEFELGTVVQRYVKLEEQLKTLGLDSASPDDKAKALGLTPKEWQASIRQFEWARQKMMSHNIRLVVHIAKRYNNRGLQMEDLVQEGCLGLSRAVLKFRPELGFKFSTYAGWWIKQAIIRGITIQGRPIKLSTELVSIHNKIRHATTAITQKTGSPPTIDALAEYIKKDKRKIIAALVHSKRTLSLEEIFWQMDDVIEDPAHEQVEEDVNKEALEIVVGLLMEELTDKEKHILIRKFGLGSDVVYTYQEIAEEMGLGVQWVKHLKKQAFLKIHTLCIERNLLEGLPIKPTDLTITTPKRRRKRKDVESATSV